MCQRSVDAPEKNSQNQNNNNFDEQTPPIGSANTLKRAMTVHKLSEMLDSKEHLTNSRYILLDDLIKQRKKSTESSWQQSTTNNRQKSSLDKSVEYMNRVIAAQPSALEAIYLEALLNPDQWRYTHQLLQSSPMDNLTASERKRLNELLYKLP